MNPYIPDPLPLTALDYRLLLPLVDRSMQPGSGRRAATLCFPRLINLTEGKEVL